MIDSHHISLTVGRQPVALITGATGTLGPVLIRRLVTQGYQVRVFNRRLPPMGTFSETVRVFLGEITDTRTLRSAMDGTDVVFHLAAKLHIDNPTSELLGEYERVNVEGTRCVVETAQIVGVQRLVFFSTIAVYGNSNDQILTEDSPAKPDTFYAKTKLAAERIVLDAKRTDGQSLGAVLRFAAIYGPRIKGNYQRLVHALAHGRFIPIGDGNNRRTLIYDRDVARAAVLAVEHPDAAGSIYNVSDGGFHTLSEIISTMCAALGRRPPRFSVPVAPGRFVAGVLENAAKLFGRCSTVTRATIDKYTEDIAVNSERIQKELGFIPQYDLETGWRETIQEMREQGAL